MGHVCECWKVTRSWCAAFDLTTKGLSVVPTMGQFSIHTHKYTSLCTEPILFLTLSYHISIYSKIKVWDLQAALDPRAPASTLCLRTLVVSMASFCFCFFGLQLFKVLDVHVTLHDNQHGESVLETSNIHDLCVQQNFFIAFPGAFRPRFPPPV